MNLTPELLADLRNKADAARLNPGRPVHSSEVADMYDALPPSVVLALLDRIEELEKEHEEMASLSLEELTGWRNSQ
jgi:hypothetical protein